MCSSKVGKSSVAGIKSFCSLYCCFNAGNEYDLVMLPSSLASSVAQPCRFSAGVSGDFIRLLSDGDDSSTVPPAVSLLISNEDLELSGVVNESLRNDVMGELGVDAFGSRNPARST